VSRSYFKKATFEYRQIEACSLVVVSTLLSLQNILEDRDDLTDAQREDLIAHEFVIVWEKDHHKLRCLSKALNMKLDEVDCKRLDVQ
jgi:hypothetical protein